MPPFALLIALVLAGWLAIGLVVALLVRDPNPPTIIQGETLEDRVCREAADAVRMPEWWSPVAAIVFVAAIAASAAYPWGWF